jgi:hypothetical protein
MKIIHGRPRHPQSQGSIERSNGDIQNILGSWMRENKSTKWASALPIVSFLKNRKYHTRLNISPYKALFGQDPYIGLEKLNIDDAHVNNINNVDDMHRIAGN